MNRKLISRFLTLGMLLGVLTFGMNIVSANSAHFTYDQCINECEATYTTSMCVKKIGPFIIQTPGCAAAMRRCMFDCAEQYNVEPPIVISPF